MKILLETFNYDLVPGQNGGAVLVVVDNQTNIEILIGLTPESVEDLAKRFANPPRVVLPGLLIPDNGSH